MSAKSKGTTSSSATSSSVSSPAEGLPAASKAKVKEQIKIIVDDLELVLGDLKDVAKELKEVGEGGGGQGDGSGCGKGQAGGRALSPDGQLSGNSRAAGKPPEWPGLRQTCYTFGSCLAARNQLVSPLLGSAGWRDPAGLPPLPPSWSGLASCAGSARLGLRSESFLIPSSPSPGRMRGRRSGAVGAFLSRD